MTSERVALLIDADNVSVDVIEQAVTWIAQRWGGPHVRRAYCTAEMAVKHQELFKRLSIRPMVNLAAGKNSTDIALAVDAIDLVVSERPATVVIASSDSDFAPLVSRLREKGCRVIGVGQKGKTGDETQALYDEFEVLSHRAGGRAGTRSTGTRQSARGAAGRTEADRSEADRSEAGRAEGGRAASGRADSGRAAARGAQASRADALVTAIEPAAALGAGTGSTRSGRGRGGRRASAASGASTTAAEAGASPTLAPSLPTAKLFEQFVDLIDKLPVEAPNAAVPAKKRNSRGRGRGGKGQKPQVLKSGPKP